MNEYKIRKKLEDRKGLNKDTVNNLLFGFYTPKKPSDFFVNRMSEINNDLNRKEGLNLPNPYFEAQPFINEIINKNNRINLLEGDISFSQLGAQLPQVRSAPVTQQTGINPTAINPNNFTQQANNNYSSLTSLEKDRLLFNNR